MSSSCHVHELGQTLTPLALDSILRMLWVCMRLHSMKNIWNFYLLLGGGKGKASITSKKRYGENCKAGKVNFYFKQDEKFFSN